MNAVPQTTEFAVADVKPVRPAKPALPTFEERWWYSAKRLDARPVIWALENRPQDFELTEGGTLLKHIPSKHYFSFIWPASARLYDANCSCMEHSSRRFQRGQGFAFVRAFYKFAAPHLKARNEALAQRRARQRAESRQRFEKHFVG